MKTIKVSEATGIQLDWLVAKCEGDWVLALAYFLPNHSLGRMNFSTNWPQSGPLVEREGISIVFHEQGHWTASNLHGTVCGEGPTPLIATMRCYVTSKLGDTAEVPEELT